MKNLITTIAACLYLSLFNISAVLADSTTQPSAFKICPESDHTQQAYALCATAQCFTIDNVTYCKCDKKVGKSISLPFNYRENGSSKDVCDIMQESGQGNFLVSTFSPPPELYQSYQGQNPLAIYTCTGANNLSAQCDGGLCFKGTSGTQWPFLGAISEDEIVCSCPPATAAKAGFQFIGPADCDSVFFNQYCGITDSKKTGTALAVGSVTGSGTILTKLLTGSVEPFNKCVFPL